MLSTLLLRDLRAVIMDELTRRNLDSRCSYVQATSSAVLLGGRKILRAM